MLKVKDLSVYYGAIQALKGISFHVNEGEIVTLIGANGAGKTTTLNAISALVPVKSGSIDFKNLNLLHLPAHERIYNGMAHVPEGRRVFARMSVKENLEMGAFSRKDRNMVAQDAERVYEHFPRLKERRHQTAGTLSGGEQQMLAIGRALMSNPSLIMMDEPSMGLAPILVSEIFGIINEINNEGTTVLLVEQNATMALSVADRAYVLETGKIVLEGTAEELSKNEAVKKAYLGTV
ncbi:MAG: ABC transporter ATP-binding protein [Eubacteriales bacterium]|nr:ABC transporter ATP-binding protein [Eubacteriales bacterium]